MNLIRHPYWSEPSSWEGAHFQKITLVKTSTSTDHVSKKLNTVDIFSAVHQKLNMFYYLFQHYLTPPSYNHSSFWIVRPPAKITTFLYPIQPHTYIYTYIWARRFTVTPGRCHWKRPVGTARAWVLCKRVFISEMKKKYQRKELFNGVPCCSVLIPSVRYCSPLLRDSIPPNKSN